MKEMKTYFKVHKSSGQPGQRLNIVADADCSSVSPRIAKPNVVCSYKVLHSGQTPSPVVSCQTMSPHI